MSRRFTRLLGHCALLSLLAALPVGQAIASWDDGYYHDYADLPVHSRWMATLHDDTKLHAITMPGTHGSAARHGGVRTENQTLTLRQQLDAGIRFLDLRTRHVNNALLLHHGPVYQHLDFDQALDQITAFLRDNPTETVLIRVMQEHTPAGNSRSFGQTVDSYFDKHGSRFATNARLDSPLRDLRGKIVLFKHFSDDTRFGKLNYHKDTIRQDDYHLGTNWDLYGKWMKVKHFINHANTITKDPKYRVMPFVNYLSGSGGALPFFVASGNTHAATGAAALATGKATPFFNDWEDFPRGSCFLWFCTIYFEGTNTLAKNVLRAQHIDYAGIIAADFPGAGLIDATIEVNRTRRPLVSALNGQCLDIENGYHASHRLITWPCNGQANQKFTMRNGMIMIGDGAYRGLCLDVADWNRQRANVIAWPCHGGANQRWKVQNDGSIRSLMPGPARCLDVIVEERNRVGLWDCHGPSPDQKFRTRLL